MVTSIISSQILIQCCKGTTFFWNEQIKMNKSYIKTLASTLILPDKSYLNHGFWRNFGMRDFRLPLHYHSDVHGWRFVKSHFPVFCFHFFRSHRTITALLSDNNRTISYLHRTLKKAIENKKLSPCFWVRVLLYAFKFCHGYAC